MKAFQHIAFYKFVTVYEPIALKEKLLRECRERGLRGTILVAREGINGMIAGAREKVAEFKNILVSDEPFKDVRFKETSSDFLPFKKLLVKFKNSILTLKGDALPFDFAPGQYVTPQELERWLQSSEDVVLLDTRNDFEVKVGTFSGSLNPSMKSFSDFVEFASLYAQNLRNKKIVAFCTGGIRAEKASAVLLKQGLTDVYQLQGGILDYFAKTSGYGFEGSCFVFDDRVALDKTLAPAKD